MRYLFFIVFVTFSLFGCINSSEKSDKGADDLSAGQCVQAENDSSFIAEGVLRIGHEVRCFVAGNDTLEHWVVDKTGKLYRAYDEAAGGIPKSGTPVWAKLRVVNAGKTEIGFSDGYHDTYYVMEVLEIKSLK